METLLCIVVWTALAVAAGVFAEQRGRNGFGWFAIGFLLSPLVAFVFLLVLPIPAWYRQAVRDGLR